MKTGKFEISCLIGKWRFLENHIQPPREVLPNIGELELQNVPNIIPVCAAKYSPAEERRLGKNLLALGYFLM